MSIETAELEWVYANLFGEKTFEARSGYVLVRCWKPHDHAVYARLRVITPHAPREGEQLLLESGEVCTIVSVTHVVRKSRQGGLLSAPLVDAYVDSKREESW
jgi:hypothetical protein